MSRHGVSFRRSIWASAWLLAFATCTTPYTEGKRASATDHRELQGSWTPEMQLEVRRVTNPRISPSGKQIVFQVAHADLESDQWALTLYIAPTDSSGRDVPLRCKDCRDAYWGANDTTLYVLAPDEDERERVQRLDLTTGTLTPITPEEDRIGWFEPSPDGAWIAYTTFETESGASDRWKIHAVATSGVRTHTWIAPESVAEFSWSPSSDRIVAVYLPADTMDWRKKSIAILDLNSRRITRLDTGPGLAWLPLFGPQGRRIAFVASPENASWMRDFEPRVLDLATNRLTTLAATPDRNIELLAWQSNGSALLGLEYEGSTRRLVSVPLDGSQARYLGPEDRSIVDAHVRSDRIAFKSERWDEPAEVFVANLPDLTMRQVSSVQPKLSAPLGRTIAVQWQADDGTEVEGLLTYPVGYRAGQRVPLLVRLHGGPPFPASDGYLGRTYFTAYPFASMASAGFAILQPNFRGSAGYGREFRHGIHSDWGGQDYRDLIAGVDALIARGVADPKRMGVMGWSYGGYLSAWAITQDDRFAAASMGAAMTDLQSWDEETTLFGMLADWFGGADEERLRKCQERSPLTHAQNVRCPVLVQHGLHDRRVPIEPVKRFVDALERKGIEVEFHTYDGGHGPRNPSDELAVLQQNLDWFARTIRDVEAAD